MLFPTEDLIGANKIDSTSYLDLIGKSIDFQLTSKKFNCFTRTHRLDNCA